jgi:hypothetical protein
VYLKLSLFLTFFLASIKLYSQNFEGGIFLGLAASQVSGDNLAGFNKPGMIAGAFTATPISKKMMLQFELKFIQKGSWATDGRLSNYKLNLNYIESPFLLKYPYKKFKFEAGLAVATLINYTEQSDIGDVNDSRIFNRFEFASILGFDYTISDRLIVNLKYNNSFLPIREHPGGNTYLWNRGQYNTVLELSLRYRIKVERLKS